jgi:capsular polysaccharide export protein
MAHRRTILFLQGPPSTFWSQLADAVEAQGAGVRRVHLCLADALFWRRRDGVSYRGRLSRWRGWLTDFVRAEGVTDILYYADRLPYHSIAAEVARAEGIAAHASEFGYLRPDWITLEREGTGAFSHFPDDAAALRADAPDPDPTPRHAHRFEVEAAGEVAFGLSLTFGRPLYPFYVSDRRYPPLFDYACWLARLARARGAARRAATAQARLLEGSAPFFLLALQIQSDYQLRASSPYRHQGDMIAETLADFAAHAPRGRRIGVKLHPLDNGWENWPAVIARAATAAGISDRVETIEGGDLGPLVGAAQGVVVINSTVGVHALRAGKPVKALGPAVFAMAGLTDQRPLAAFWSDPAPPDPATLRAFLATLADEIQVRGSFYEAEGRRAAAAEIAARLVEGRVGPRGFAPGAPPPRLAGLNAARRARGLPPV